MPAEDNFSLKGKKVAEATALGRTGLPDDIGPMVVSLLEGSNRWVTSQRTEVSGGMVLLMRLAIFGATGAVGRTLLVHMLKGADLLPGDEIVLIGRGDRASHDKLLAIRSDLLDSCDTGVITLSVCNSLDDLQPPDIFIMAAGATIGAGITQRSQLATKNLALFQSVAAAVASRCPNAFVLVISNPVELAVSVFCSVLDRKRVVGMGAQQDSLRFARAIAESVGIPRWAVQANALGEHGPHMVPLWSSVSLVDESPGVARKFDEQKEYSTRELHSPEFQRLHASLTRLISQGQFQEVHQHLHGISPALRILIEPLLTVTILHSTPNATANATLHCIAAIRHGDTRAVCGQVLLDGEFCDLRGVTGAPLALNRHGWIIGKHTAPTEAELDELRHATAAIHLAYQHLLDLTEAAVERLDA